MSCLTSTLGGMPDQVIFQPAIYGKGIRAGIMPTYPNGPVTPAYVESKTDAADRIELAGKAADGRPIFKSQYWVLTNGNPSNGLSRPLTVDDHVYWVNQGITLQVLEDPQPQSGPWLTQCIRVD